MYSAEYARSVIVVEALARSVLSLIPVDCVSDIWTFAKPCLTGFTEPEKVAIGVQASPYYKRRDGSGLLLLRRWKRYQCGILEVRQSGETIRHHNLNVGFLLCLAIDVPAGGLVCVEQNTGRSCRFTDWECDNIATTTAERQPSRVSWQNLLGYLSRSIFCSRENCFYGFSWRSASIIRIHSDGTISTFLECEHNQTQCLCVYEHEEHEPQILLLHRTPNELSSSVLLAFSLDGQSLGEVSKVDLINCDMDVDNEQALCFVIGYYDGPDTLTVAIIDIHRKSTCTQVSLPEVSLSRTFVRSDGGLWVITEDSWLMNRVSPAFHGKRQRSALIIQALVTRYGGFLPTDCLVDTWDLLLPRLEAFTAPRIVATDILPSSCCRLADGSGLLILRDSSLYECVVLELTSNNNLNEHKALNVGTLLCLACDSKNRQLIGIEQNTGRMCRFSNWTRDEPRSGLLLPSWTSGRTTADCLFKPVFSSHDGCFYGLSWQGESVIRIDQDGSTSTVIDCSQRPAEGLCVYESEERSQILLLQRDTNDSVVSAISNPRNVLSEVVKLDVYGRDLDVDNERDQCFIIGYHRGSKTLTVSIIDLRQNIVSIRVPLPCINFCRFFVSKKGCLWFVRKNHSVVCLDPVFA